MNPPIQPRQTTPVFLAAFGLVCFGLLPQAQAVSPPPDGGYPGGNTAEGQNALLSLSSGGYNAAIGWLSLESNVTGTANTAVGAGTLASLMEIPPPAQGRFYLTKWPSTTRPPGRSPCLTITRREMHSQMDVGTQPLGRKHSSATLTVLRMPPSVSLQCTRTRLATSTQALVITRSD